MCSSSEAFVNYSFPSTFPLPEVLEGTFSALASGALVQSDDNIFCTEWRFRRTYQEEAPWGPLLCADLSHRSCSEEAASYWPQHVLTC